MSDFSHEQILKTIPSHLQQYVVEQIYDHYTFRDQAVWRYIMRKNLNFLSEHAHHSYLEGLKKTGITTENIPDVEEMNRALSQIGWRAVVVNGFIPPAAFMEFQAHKILVISAEVRTVEHILYTPAPDIVHEAAGHAPIIADTDYALYLQKFGEYGAKAMASAKDFAIYEAIRHLSIIKEYADATEGQIREAEEALNARVAENQVPSEAALLSRLHWWTVEYGLVGTPDNFKLYGAGLLSSVGESQHCLDPAVKKIPLSVDCVQTDYDITTMQPQLYVARDWPHLTEVLEEYANRMCFRRGGLESIEKAIESNNVATLVYSSGLQVSGKLVNVIAADQQEAYLQFAGPCALAYDDRQLPGHGTDYHHEGFGSPVGYLKDSNKPLEHFSDSDLAVRGIEKDKQCTITFTSGIEVSGIVQEVLKREDKIQLIQFSDCAVKDQNGRMLFRPEWGVYDMAVGEKIVSVFAGTADKEKFNVLPPKSEETAIRVSYSEKEKNLFDIYQKFSDMKENKSITADQAESLFSELIQDYPDEWLAYLELLEIVKNSGENTLQDKIRRQLQAIAGQSDDKKKLIEDGLAL